MPPPRPWRGRRPKAAFMALLIVLLSPSTPAATNPSSGLPLNDFIRHFEPAFYPPLDTISRQKRNANFYNEKEEDHAKHLSFNVTAHNRLFRVKVHNVFAQATDVFAENAIIENTDGILDASRVRRRIFAGSLEDLPTSSTVHGIVTEDGLFDGHISTPEEMYYIEPASRYFEAGKSDKQPFHSVIYKASDVIHPADNEPCKSHEIHLRRKEAMAASAKKATTSPRTSFSSVILKKRKRRKAEDAEAMFENLKDSESIKDGSPVVLNFEANGWSLKGLGGGQQQPRSAKQVVTTTFEIVDWEDVPESIKHHFRKRNEARLALAEGRGVIDKKKKTCMLYLQADHLFYEAMGSEEACIEAMTRHVQRVNSIYEPVDFDQDGEADSIRFMIKRIKVHTSKALDDPSYRFPGNYGVEKFLEIFSEENYDAFCLAYMFTYRDFEGGTLGLAWTGDMKNAGGVCERNGHYRGTLKSLNTGIITLLNYGKHVPPAVSHVTMAHEMGHNFGSPHDPENNKACVPGGEDGNYIMFARATSGDKSNNRKFSPCSLKSIKPVLLSKAIGPKGCFQEPTMALCGNGVVEEGEQCDCGWEEDCEEDCCWPQRTEPLQGQKPCTLRPKKDCSPSQGPCCTNGCTFKFGEQCLDDNGCRQESFCDGTSPVCPLSAVKPNKTVCNTEFVCYKGECTGSICLAYGLESCQCSQGPEDSPTKPCELCCKEPGDGKPCLSSFELTAPPFDVPDMYSKPGTPCNNYAGYCDVFQKCREVDPSGPLATLRKLLLSEASLASLKRFLETYWYTVIFIGLAVLLLMAVIIKICGKKTPLVRSRRKRRNRHNNVINEAAEAIEDEAAVQVHPTAAEAVPFGKKVREAKRRKTTASEAAAASIEANTVEDGVARAVRLAANLGNQLFVDLPPEATVMPKRGRGGQRKHKSLSPEKRLATSLAQSMTSISKSFEKLDLVGRRHRRRSHSRPSRGQDNKKRRSRTPKEQKEVTIAKLGRFKFSVEVARHFEAAEAKKEAKSSRKISSSKKEAVVEASPARKEAVPKLPSIHVTNFNVQPPSSVLVSKKRAERPRREKKASIDYRRSFSSDKFTRSISHPGPAPSLEEIKAAASKQPQRPRSVKLKRSETERMMPRPSTDGLWVSEFDNHGFEAAQQQQSSLSLTSLTNSSPTKFDLSSSSSSTDSDLEVVKTTPNSISRAKILETVGVIVGNVTTASSANNLLLPPSSSSPTSSSSVSLTGASSPSSFEAEQPRLAFIGCETTSNLSSPVSNAATSKRPSLSERYPTTTTSSCSSSEGAKEDVEDNLDIISIITDGMT